MNLCIDIGNSSAKVVIFDGDEIVETQLWKDDYARQARAILKAFSIQQSILSSVANHPLELEEVLRENGYCIALNHDTPLPIKNAYKTPKTLGQDRIAAAVGAWGLFPNEHCLVIDAGTCITYDFVHKTGEYRGGGISPGIEMRLNAMHHFTAKLPLLNKQRLESFIGYNTESSMRVGAQYGTLYEVNGFIENFNINFSHIRVIITGGDAPFFEKNLKVKIFVNQHLVLIGLNQILNYNVQFLA